MHYINNAFSLSMLENDSLMSVYNTTEEVAKRFAIGCKSVVGHEDTAKLYSKILGISIPMNRCTTKLLPGDQMLVGQYTGPRLPEGAVSLPEGATIQWKVVTIE